MRNRTICRAELALLAVLTVLFSWGTALERQQQAISDRIIRLHVTADSDDPEDQANKLLVRDAVLAAAEPLLADVSDGGQARSVLRENLGTLEQEAGQALAAAGAADPVRVTLARELFGTRRYEGFSLPGGYYDALRVQIGSGEGRNWWCVVYPQICTAATAEDRQAVAAMGGLEPEQMAILEGETPEYRLKFRTIELLEDLLGWFRGGAAGIPAGK